MTAALAAGDPERIGGYALAGRLGSGGQGVVYEGYGESGERVAVKVLHVESSLRRPFGKEVAAARRVAAFCTARILAADLDGDRPYIVSEFVDGPSLRQAVTEYGPYTGDALLRLAIGTATAMAAIHDAGVAHCDLKPDNVLLGPDGPRVIDFGIARIVDHSLTASRGVVGTPGYMSPELFSGGLPGPATDVFAWGAVMVFAATGQAPFERDHVAAVIHQVLRSEVDLTRLDHPLRGLVAAALAKDPAARPGARDLLLGLLGGGQPGDPHATLPPSPAGDLLDAGSRAAAGLAGSPGVPPLGDRAERAFAELSPGAQGLAAQLLLRMVRPGEAGDDLVSVDPGEVAGLSGETTIEPVLDVLNEGGIVRGNGSGVGIANPALLKAWPRLRDLVAEEREGLATYQRLREAARSWNQYGRREGDLYNGVALEQATAWAATARRRLELSPVERSFLTGSAGLARRRARRRRALSGVLAVLLIGATALAGLAELNRREAQDAKVTIAAQRDEAVARGLAAKADTLRESDPAAALLLSAAAARIARVPDTEHALIGSLGQPDVVRRVSQAIGVGEDGRSLIEVSNGTATVTDAITGATVATVRGVPKDVRRAHLSMDRSRLALASCSDVYCGDETITVTLWLTETGVRTDKVVLEPEEDNSLIMLAFDGHQVVRRKAECGRSPVVVGQAAALGLRACSTDKGFGLTDGDGRVTASRLIDNKREVEQAVLGPDGRMLAVQWHRETDTSSLRGVDLWTVDGTRIGKHLARGVYPEYQPVADGSSGSGECELGQLVLGDVLTTERCGQVIIWSHLDSDPDSPPDLPGDELSPDVASMGQLARYEHSRGVQVNATQDGRFLTIVGGGDLRVADTSAYARKGSAALRALRSAAFSPDGRMMAAMDDTALHLTDITTGRTRVIKEKWVSPNPSQTLENQPMPPIRFSPDGRLVAVNGDQAEVVLVEAATGKVTGRLTVPHDRTPVPDVPSSTKGDILAMDFAPDGKTLAMATDITAGDVGDHVRVWDLTAAREVAQIPVLAESVYFSADGKSLITGHLDSGLCAIDLAVRKSTCPDDSRDRGFRLSGYVTGPLGFSPDRKHMLLRLGGGSVVLWDPVTGKITSKIMRGHTGRWISAAAFSPDGRLLATGGYDNLVVLWDLASGTAIGRPFRHHGDVLAVAFAADGRTLHSVDVSGAAHVQRLDPEGAAHAVCAKAGRDLTDEERRLHGVPVSRACQG
ncbi:serine/threonine-protein kinase [Nonomuraea sp. NPDC046570]|uniref:serine/threonine-protein kinase n=1 Tax=Nonomuraea sp. NPDC046570 TaxID=3155255 RepID=UPI0033C966F2